MRDKENGLRGNDFGGVRGGIGGKRQGYAGESGSVAAMGRYMESTAPLPEGASVEGRTMTMLTDGRLAYLDAKSGLHL